MDFSPECKDLFDPQQCFGMHKQCPKMCGCCGQPHRPPAYCNATVAESAVVEAAPAEATPAELTPAAWPPVFHAALRQNRSGELAQVDLYYDWQGGRNLHVIRKVGQEPFYDNERQNGSTYYYTPGTEKCKAIDMKVGLLPPNWLQGARFRGEVALVGPDAGTRACHVWEKGDAEPPHTGPFIVYYADVATGLPVRWVFFDGAIFDVIAWRPGEGPPSEAYWQLPSTCFRPAAAAVATEAVPEVWGGELTLLHLRSGDHPPPSLAVMV